MPQTPPSGTLTGITAGGQAAAQSVVGAGLSGGTASIPGAALGAGLSAGLIAGGWMSLPMILGSLFGGKSISTGTLSSRQALATTAGKFGFNIPQGGKGREAAKFNKIAEGIARATGFNRIITARDLAQFVPEIQRQIAVETGKVKRNTSDNLLFKSKLRPTKGLTGRQLTGALRFNKALEAQRVLAARNIRTGKEGRVGFKRTQAAEKSQIARTVFEKFFSSTIPRDVLGGRSSTATASGVQTASPLLSGVTPTSTKRKKRTVGRRSTILTSPLGIAGGGTGTLG